MTLLLLGWKCRSYHKTDSIARTGQGSSASCLCALASVPASVVHTSQSASTVFNDRSLDGLWHLRKSSVIECFCQRHTKKAVRYLLLFTYLGKEGRWIDRSIKSTPHPSADLAVSRQSRESGMIRHAGKRGRKGNVEKGKRCQTRLA